MPRSHDDATSLMRRILDNPADALPRLVFADWLDESGEPADAAWAEYIRLRAQAAADTNSITRSLSLDRAADAAVRITAQLTLPAAHFVPHFPTFLDLLPGLQFLVTLDGFTVPRYACGTLTADRLRDLGGLPLARTDGVTLIGTPELGERPEEVFGRYFAPVVVVRIPSEDFGPALNRAFPLVRMQVFTQRVTRLGPPIERGHPATHTSPASVAELLAGWSDRSNPLDVLHQVLAEARSTGATALDVAPEEGGYTIRYTLGGESLTRYPLPAPAGRRLVEAAGRLPRRRLRVQVVRRELPDGRAVRVILLPPREGRP